jgi:hypothetical protein
VFLEATKKTHSTVAAAAAVMVFSALACSRLKITPVYEHKAKNLAHLIKRYQKIMKNRRNRAKKKTQYEI